MSAKKVITYIVIFLAFVATIGGCYMKYRGSKINNANVNYQARQSQPIERKVDKQGNEHTKVAIEQVPYDIYKHTNDSLLNALNKEIKAKNLISANFIKLKKRTDSVFAHFQPNTDTITSNDTIHHPKPFAHIEDCITISGEVSDSGVSLQYEIPEMNISIINGWQNPGLFQRKVPTTKVVVDKCNSVDTMRNISTTPPPKKFVETRGFAFGLGYFLGLLTGLAK